MSTTSPLLIDLAGVARLADVRRPVATVWRTRFATATDPFPPPVSEKGGRAFFDALSVAQWLARTEHGNNPDAVADAAAAATPAGFDVADPAHVAAVDALLALRAVAGVAVADRAITDLHALAVDADPDDACLVSEISTVRPAWTEWADMLADAAYSPLEASRLLERGHQATMSSAGSAGPLRPEAEAVIVALAEALVDDQAIELALGAGITPSLAAELLSHIGDDAEPSVFSQPEGRAIRRRLLCDGTVRPRVESAGDLPRLHVMRLPAGVAGGTADMLQAIDDLVLGMRDHDRAAVVAPAAVLTGPLSAADGLARTDILRSGRVRAIVRLPAGLVTSAPREPLALWVLGRETGDVPIGDRYTAVADLTGTALTPATRADVTSDVLAAMGSAFDIRAHAFRFVRLVRTTSLLASRVALVTGRSTTTAERRTRDLPALLDRARADLGDDAPPLAAASVPGPTAPIVRVEELIAERHLRVLPGTRVAPEEYSDSGLVAIGAGDLDDHTRIGHRRVDSLLFAARHPSARFTEPGDIVFRTAPTARAWVDPDGSKVVVHPARVFRINGADPGGLVPELVAADIEQAPGGPGSWRRWRPRRVAPSVIEPLRNALNDIATRRDALTKRIEALDTYAELLAAAVVSGTVTLTDNAADAASDSH